MELNVEPQYFRILKKTFPSLEHKIISAEEIVGTKNLNSPDDYMKMINGVNTEIMNHKGKLIHLCINTTVGFSCLLGQVIGHNISNIQTYQYNQSSQTYEKLPLIESSWLTI